MKLHLELFRYGTEDGIPMMKRGQLALLIRTGSRHVDVMADAEDKFDLDTISAVVEALKKRERIINHLIGEEAAG